MRRKTSNRIDTGEVPRHFNLPNEMLTEARLSLLESKKTLFLNGFVDEDMADYVRESTMLLSAQTPEGSPNPPLTVRITSPGGDVTSGMEIHDQLLLYGPVTGIVVGYAHSAASMLILQGCYDRYATENSRIMCHNGMMLPFVTRHNLESKGWHQRLIREFTIDEQLIRKILMDRTGKNEQEIRKLLIREQFLSAQEAFEFGLIDGIIKFDFKRAEDAKTTPKRKRTRRTKDKNAS